MFEESVSCNPFLKYDLGEQLIIENFNYQLPSCNHMFRIVSLDSHLHLKLGCKLNPQWTNSCAKT